MRMLLLVATMLTAVGGASDPARPDQYGLDQVRAEAAWDRSQGEGIVIAIVDSGVDLDHPDLAERLVEGVDLVDGDTSPDDGNGHGTHVAGIAAATMDNGIAGTGAAPRASIMPIRVFDADGGATNATISQGIDAAIEAGADVINLSLGDQGVADRLRRGGPINLAIGRATDAGVVVVSAAGNDGQRETVYRNATSLLVVAAVGPDGERASFSNFGDARTVAAPGVDIVSTAPPEPTVLFPSGTDGTATLSGTSMASPFVAAEAAILLAAGYDADETIARIQQTAQPADPTLGSGLVDFDAATAEIPTTTQVPTTAEPEQAAGDPDADPTAAEGDSNEGSAGDAGERTWRGGRFLIGLAAIGLGVLIAHRLLPRRRA